MRNRRLSRAVLLVATFLAATLASPGLGYPAATITVVNLDSAGEGFNDPSGPDGDSTNGGNAGATLGQQRLIAFQFAANVWASLVDSSVEIKIGANFDPLFCDATGAILGQAGPTTAHRDFTGALKASTWYPAALANKLGGTDLDPSSNDVAATFNSAIGTTCAFLSVWYYGLDANPPAGKIDFVTVVVHELGHGLGFLSFVDLATGAKFLGLDDTYMLNLEDHSTAKLYPQMSEAERVTASTDTGDLHWVGPAVVASSGILTAGRHSSGHVEMYAPNPQEPGSSVSHFSNALAPDELMEPVLTGTNHDVGLALELFADIGWFPGVDVYFLVDLSGSFADDLPSFKAQAPTIIANLKASNPNTRFGLGSFEDYPISPFGDAGSGDVAYRRDIDLTLDAAAVEALIAGLFTRFGVDGPQSQLPALFQTATGAGQDLSGVGFPGASIAPGLQATFRAGASRLILLWTDAPFHRPGDPGTIPYPGPSFTQAVDALLALTPPAKVIGISSAPEALPDLQAIAQATGALAPPGGVDCDGDGTIDVLAGQPLVCSLAFAGDIGGAIVALVTAAATTPVEVDVKPGTFPNRINTRSRGVIPVAILTTASFDATTVNPLSVQFGPNAAQETHGAGHIEDANGDGRPDLVLHFRTEDSGIACGATSAAVSGQDLDGHAITGSDSITPVGCK